MTRYECPVCWQPISPTIKGNIAVHRDKIAEPCPGSGEPWKSARLIQDGLAVEFVA